MCPMPNMKPNLDQHTYRPVLGGRYGDFRLRSLLVHQWRHAAGFRSVAITPISRGMVASPGSK
jgi:hypothetical protein